MSVVFFTDRDLGTQFPAILSTAGLRVERHADHFPPDCADDVWLHAIAAKGWVALAFLADHPPPVIGKVYRASAADILKKPGAAGRVEIWYPKE